MAFTARYRGSCQSGCGQISVGDQIRRSGRGYAHVDCNWPGGEGDILRAEQAQYPEDAIYRAESRDFGGHCEDAPCCGCCGPGTDDPRYAY